jgi:flagellar hook-length control protein FliK
MSDLLAQIASQPRVSPHPALEQPRRPQQPRDERPASQRDVAQSRPERSNAPRAQDEARRKRPAAGDESAPDEAVREGVAAPSTSSDAGAPEGEGSFAAALEQSASPTPSVLPQATDTAAAALAILPGNASDAEAQVAAAAAAAQAAAAQAAAAAAQTGRANPASAIAALPQHAAASTVNQGPQLAQTLVQSAPEQALDAQVTDPSTQPGDSLAQAVETLLAVSRAALASQRLPLDPQTLAAVQDGALPVHLEVAAPVVANLPTKPQAAADGDETAALDILLPEAKDGTASELPVGQAVVETALAQGAQFGQRQQTQAPTGSNITDLALAQASNGEAGVTPVLPSLAQNGEAAASNDGGEAPISGLTALPAATPGVERSNGAARPEAAAPAAQPQLPRELEQSVSKQVQRALVHQLANGDRMMTLRLTPPDLGTVKIELVERQGSVTVRFHIEDESVRSAVERQLPALRQDLRAADAPVSDVHLADNFQSWNHQQQQANERRGERRQHHGGFSLDGRPVEEEATPVAAVLGGLADASGVNARA